VSIVKQLIDKFIYWFRKQRSL